MTHVNDWTTIVNTLSKKYQSETRIRAIEDELDNMIITEFEDRTNNKTQAVQFFVKRIENLVPQCQIGWKNDSYKLKYLFGAFLMKDWADGPISSLTQHPTYETLLDSLVTAEKNKQIWNKLLV